jgi:TetR/AcrR family transcriptional regulator, mexJK operon transcriptional repressor
MSKTDIERQFSQHNVIKRKGLKELQILQGALPEFLQHGYSGTSMDRIAKSAGVSKQTLYSYYSDKNGLFTALIEHITSQIESVWSESLTGKPRLVLRKIADKILTGIQTKEYLNFVRLIVAESQKRPDLSQLYLNSTAKPAIQYLTRYFQDCPQVNLKDPEATAKIFIDSLMYFIIGQEILHGKEIFPLTSDRYVDNLIDLILNEGD